ncbi:hypothetical protein ABBQ38_010403 [Trebouxia sp. C0009 RCD-2024]
MSVQGPDARGARYTLLGFVEHLGTMRSGHYVAYVQRGMDDADSLPLQSLLHKHGLAAQPPPGASDSSSVPPAHGKKQKKSAAPKAMAPGSSTDKGAASSSPPEEGAAASKHGKPAARDAETCSSDAVATDGIAAGLDDHNAPSCSAVHMNGQADQQQSVPDDWESDGGKPADKSHIDSHIPSPEVRQADGGGQPTDTSAAASDTASAVGPAASLTPTKEGPVVGQPTPPPKESDTAQVGSRREKAAAEDKTAPGQRSWFYISDTQVKAVSEADILRREAYILLYMRID